MSEKTDRQTAIESEIVMLSLKVLKDENTHLKQQLSEAIKVIEEIATPNPVYYCWGLRDSIEKFCSGCEENTKEGCYMNPIFAAKQFLQTLKGGE